MKIIVYAISKNEEKFVERWYNSMKEADDIYVLDTGSTDKTVEKLKSLGVNVKTKKISPWRFDVARNESLNLVPLDANICVCTDIDELFIPGWRKILEDTWQNSSRAKYTYNYTFSDNKPVVSFYQSKIHSRLNYTWTHPIHEVLTYIGKQKENVITIDELSIGHFPDITKSRSSYLPMLIKAVKENPTDDRNMFYLGREYMYYKNDSKAITTLKKYLKLEGATWKDERSAAMRFIARCYSRKNDFNKAIKWYDKSIKEAPYLRDSYVEKALVLYDGGKYNEIIYLCNMALDIEKNNKSYIPEEFSFDGTIEDLLSLCYYYKNNKELALYYIDKALVFKPNNERLKNNRKLFEK